MKTIFSAQRKHPKVAYVTVYWRHNYERADYVMRDSRQDRDDIEDYYREICWAPPLYRVNVFPKIN
jgi:hypothetical protein